METYVHLLTTDQATEIADKEYTVGVVIDGEYIPGSLFNPILDLFDNYVISITEADKCNNPLYIWVKDTPIIIYDPKPRII